MTKRTWWNLGELHENMWRFSDFYLGLCMLCMWADRKHIREQYFGHSRSAGWHCSDIEWGTYQVQNGAKMQLGAGEIWGHIGRQRAVWSVFQSSKRSLTSAKRRGEVIREHTFSGCFGSRFRDMEILVHKMVMRCNVNVNLSDLLPEMIFGALINIPSRISLNF